MRFEELVRVLNKSNTIRVIKDDNVICVGFIGCVLTEMAELGGKMFEQLKDETVKKFQCEPEITHKRWKELNLLPPMQPEEMAQYSFSDLQMKLYYTVYL